MIASPAYERMSRQATRDTAPEMALRRELHCRGLRYRIHVRPLQGVRRTADIVFRRPRVAVFVDGCFWHMCPDHRTFPATNNAFWKTKLARNVDRDRETDQLLSEAGWLVIRAWEHEDPRVVADRIEAILRGSAMLSTAAAPLAQSPLD